MLQILIFGKKPSLKLPPTKIVKSTLHQGADSEDMQVRCQIPQLQKLLIVKELLCPLS